MENIKMRYKLLVIYSILVSLILLYFIFPIKQEMLPAEISPSYKYTYVVSENEEYLFVHILENNKVVYTSTNRYRKKDKFTIVWDANRIEDNVKQDFLWIESSDIGLYVIYNKNNSWIEEPYNHNNKNYKLPEMFR